MMTLYDKIREAVFREPRITRKPGAANLLSEEDGPVGLNAAKSDGPVTRTVGNVEVFNTYGEEAVKAEEAVLPNVQAAQDGLGESLETEGARQAPSGGAHHARYGGGLNNMARAGHQDGDRINSLTATVAAIQATVATDPQQSRDLANRARIANDAIRVHSGLVK